MILSFINISREVLKTLGLALGFQHFPQDLAIVNKWKIKIDLSIHSTEMEDILDWLLLMRLQDYYMQYDCCFSDISSCAVFQHGHRRV